MLGDVGANTLGMQVGMIAAIPQSRLFRTGMAGITLGLIGAAEVVSFSKVIDSVPFLSKLDQLGVKQAGDQ
jgi:F420-0:gamma-glutamyl ligase